jgi:hypothetical protein
MPGVIAERSFERHYHRIRRDLLIGQVPTARQNPTRQRQRECPDRSDLYLSFSGNKAAFVQNRIFSSESSPCSAVDQATNLTPFLEVSKFTYGCGSSENYFGLGCDSMRK